MRLREIRKIIVFVICMTFMSGIYIKAVSAATDVLSGIKRLDLTAASGIFNGESDKIEYYFSFPSEWNELVFVEWVGVGDDTKNELEHMNFYCKSKNGALKPALMFSLYVYDRKNWRDDLQQEIVIKNSLYVFAVDYTYVRGFSDEAEQKHFRSVWEKANTPERIKGMIELVGATDNISLCKVYINNVAIDSPPLHIDGIYYVPLRAVAEALGFVVQWRDYDKTVMLYRQSALYDYFQIKANMVSDKRGIKMRLINDKTYVHTAYLTQILKKSVDIDEGNVYIYK